MLKYFAILGFVLTTASCQSCDGGWDLYGGNCYSFLPSSATWNESRVLCNDSRAGADLATVKESNTLRDLYVYIKTFDLHGSFWLGGSDEEFEGDWHWVDNVRIQFGTNFWALNSDLIGWSLEPLGGKKENCLAMNKDRFYYFDDNSCADTYHPVCMYTP